LGVELEWIGVSGNYDNQAGFVSTAQTDVLAGGVSYDIFAGYSMTAATLALRGCTQNLLALDYLNFEKPWWPDSLIEQSTISEKLFFCLGDISCNLLYMMYCVYFNKDLITKHDLENPYELVYDNRWNVDKLIEMSKGLYEDLNGNSTSDQGDRFGLVTMNVFYDSFFWGSGLTEIEKDANGNLVISERWNSEKTLRLLEKLCPFFHESGDTFTTNSAGIHTIFDSGNALFALTEAQYSYVKYSSGIKVVRKRGEADFRNEQNKDSCQFDIFMFYNVFLDEINTIYNVSRFKLVKLKELTKGGNTMEMKFYRCRHCGNIIAYVKNSGVAVVCCGEKMQELVANTVEASYEKHIPVVKVEGDRVEVRVGSIDHPMIPEHYIEWIALQTKQGNQRKALNPGDEPAVCFAICPGDEVEAVYEYCNLHGLWKA
jgi:superoxide reductase